MNFRMACIYTCIYVIGLKEVYNTGSQDNLLCDHQRCTFVIDNPSKFTGI